ncbi:amidohydrolase family protein [Bradyrhizobium sp. dw_78]|uniref:amidohydrolase family protein n=1 Tax=Bradyrhizobium sp. dw_78 TaxID=2719793 RepID=UPI00320A4858
MIIEDGKIQTIEPYSEIIARLPTGVVPTEYPDALISAGFIDTHVHYPQVEMIGAYGSQLLEWLNNYTFVTEQKYANEAHAELAARFFLRELLRAGMQLDFVDDVVLGVVALKPKAVVLYPLHEKFHEMMGAKSRPWSEFEAAINAKFPNVKTYVAAPGDELDLNTYAAQ